MRIPATPPNADALYWRFIERLAAAEESGRQTLTRFLASIGPTDPSGRYLHWEDFRFRPPPEGLDPQTAWALTRMARKRLQKTTPFHDVVGQSFSYVPVEHILKSLHSIDSEAHGGLRFAAPAPSENEAKNFLVKSLIEEPFNSSLLEGAATTREEAKRLIREHKRPATEGERMVLNNYRAIEFIKARQNDPLTIELIHQLHRIITDRTLENLEKSGRFRSAADDINVVDDIDNKILHKPPSATELPLRMQAICDFANAPSDSDGFTHPILRAIILHFMLAYDHPYVDGNGRTARALFYWSVLRDGYWLLEYVSISRIINKAPISYGQAFLQTETDGADLTYFLLHQLDVIVKSIDDLSTFIHMKQESVRSLAVQIESSANRHRLNHRQISLLHDAIRNPDVTYTIREQEQLHHVSYLTARSDLERLATLGYLLKSRRGQQSIYRPAHRLHQKILHAAAP